MKKFIILLSAIALVCAFGIPTMADETADKLDEHIANSAIHWNFYGSARMATWYDNPTDGASSYYGDNTIFSTGEDSDSGTIWALQGNSRIGATVQGETIGGGFEYGSGPNLRKLYGTYTLGEHEFLVGQTYTPLAYRFYSNQAYAVDDGLLSVGNVYTGRTPMLQWSFAGLRVALVKPVVDDLGFENANVDSIVPQIEARYVFKTDMFALDVFGGMNTYKIENSVTGNDDNLNAYIAGAGAEGFFGPAYVKGMFWWSQNAAQMGALNRGDASASVELRSSGEAIDNNDGIAFMVAAGFKATDALAIEAGYGYTNFSLDTAVEDDETQAIYINAIIDIAPGFFIVPEFGYYDLVDGFDGQDQGSETYFGAKWQINF